MHNRLFLLILHCISLVFLGFGWVLDILKIDISTHFMINISLFNEKRSILSMLQSLWMGGNYTPFFLVAFFGMLIPFIKSLVIFVVLVNKKSNTGIYSYLSVISKWAMADVFAISILVAFLSANAMDNINAYLEPGFYYFLAYVLLSAIVSTFVGKIVAKQ